MAKELAESGQLLGLTRESIMLLLGEPSSPDEQGLRSAAREWWYKVGMAGWARIDAVYLAVVFDRFGRAERAVVIQG